MNPGDLPLTVLHAADEACDAFEACWRGGQRPRIEDHLGETRGAERAFRLEHLLILELELLAREGIHVSPDDYLDRFPGHSETVLAAFRKIGLGGSTDGSATDSGYRTVVEPHPRPAAPGGRAGESVPLPETEACHDANLGPSPVVELLPERLGRFRVIRELGRGGFGVVYLAYDDDLKRPVALKVAHAEAGDRPTDALLTDARSAAALSHKGIVTVFEMGRLEDGGLYLVMEYIEGMTLDALLRRGRVPAGKLAGLIGRVAAAVHHAHGKGVIHRDLKPSNVLLNAAGDPFVVDFGLALALGGRSRRRGEVAGTPAYMAPEQVSGETHRIDRPTDVWALGVMFYQGLTGRLPFPGRERAEIFDEVLNREPIPPRRFDPAIPRELERIVLRCLSRRMADRYATAAELEEELAFWLADDLAGRRTSAVASSLTSATVDPTVPAEPAAPKGLRVFDGSDAGVFLRLLPGPRGKDRLPEALRFWKSRIESDVTVPGAAAPPAFSVGLLYGPSGGGKSSFVLAGLIPGLDPTRVRPIYVEAAPHATEARILSALSQVLPELPRGDDLAEVLAGLRGGEGLPQGGKVCLIIDQFEQWLQSNPAPGPGTSMVRALRQCDGTRVQALILVRDEFWVSVARFFKALEVSLAEGVNATAVELPDAQHARRVLEAFGRSCGRLPAQGALNADASAFLDEAAIGLAGPDGRVIPVRLSLFTEVVRRRDWTPATLASLGGVSGAATTFLSQTFGESTGVPSRRAWRPNAQALLEALLPPPGSLIRGMVRPASELMVASGLAGKPDAFAELLRLLDGELRLITTADPDGRAGVFDGDSPGAGDAGTATAVAPDECFYQLSHDHLVPAVRQWVEGERGATRSGRAKIRLTEVAASWRERPGPRRLPSPAEWLGILWHTRASSWSLDERKMMRAATRHHLIRGLAAALLIVGLVTLGVRWRARAALATRVAAALSGDFAALPGHIQGLSTDPEGVIGLLDDPEGLGVAEPHPGIPEVLRYRFQPRADGIEVLCRRLKTAEPDEVAAIRDVLNTVPSAAAVRAVWASANDPGAGPGETLRAACVLAGLDPQGSGWRELAAAVVRALAGEDLGRVTAWSRLLAPSQASIGPALAGLDPAVPFHPEVFRTFILELARQGRRKEATTLVEGVLADPSEPSGSDPVGAAARRQATAAALLLELGQPEAVSARLAQLADPDLRAFLIDRLSRIEGGPGSLIGRLGAKDLAPLERQALLMALAETPADRLATVQVRAMIAAASDAYTTDPDPGVHAAAGLLLRRLDQDGLLDRLNESIGVSGGPIMGRRWYHGHGGNVFAVIDAPEGWVGARPGEDGYFDAEARQYRRTGRRLAISFFEVSSEQMKKNRVAADQHLGTGGEPDSPANNVDWFDAARYCNHLSRLAGLPLVYPEPIRPGMTLDAEAVERGGYRLPTEVEWELACRAGTETARYFGDALELLPRYVCGWVNSNDRTMRVGSLLPNPLGLFDTLGNVWEWCHDGMATREGDHLTPFPEGTPESPAGDPQVAHQIVGTEGNPEQTEPQTHRYMRGGSYSYAPSFAQSGRRYSGRANLFHSYRGFRVARTLPADPQ